MGYDMYWHAPPAGDRAEFEAAQRKAHEYAQAHMDHPRSEEVQAEVERLFDAVREAEYWYFRLNIWGMQVVRDQLVELGIVRADYNEMADWPDPEDYGGAETEGFEQAQDKTLAWVPPGDSHGVAIHKLGSNDGWLVTPGEIISGLAWAEEHHPTWRQDIEDYALAFCEWMERAAHEGEGFHVW